MMKELSNSQNTRMFLVYEEQSFNDLFFDFEQIVNEADFSKANANLYRKKFGKIFKELMKGKAVVLYGKFSAELMKSLYPLFTNNRRLWINTESVDIPGHLVVVSQQPNLLPGIKPREIKHEKEEIWELLSNQFEGSNLLHLYQPFKAMINYVETRFNYQFSYASLLDMKNSLQKFPNKNSVNRFLLLFQERISFKEYKDISRELSQMWVSKDPKIKEPLTAELLDKKRCNKIKKVLSYRPFVFVSGASGTGKSTTIYDHLVDFYKQDGIDATLFVGESSMNEWVSSKPSKDELSILFLDEANLSPSDYWDLLQGLFAKPPYIILKDGPYHRFLPNQVVVCGGNLGYIELQAQQFFNDHGGVVVFDKYPQFYIKEIVILPLFLKLEKLFPFLKQYAQKDLLIDTFLEVWQNFDLSFDSQDEFLTLRNLTMTVMRYFIQHNKMLEILDEDEIQMSVM